MKRVSNKVVRLAKWIAGSWWGVVLHTAWFTAWLIYDFNINILTLAVSLEAIFIGIFLLMASDRAETTRDKREAAAQKRATDIVENIFDLETKIEKQQQQILKILIDKKIKREN